MPCREPIQSIRIGNTCSLLIGGGTPVLAQWLLNSIGSIIGVAIASALYALVSLLCMLKLLNRTGYWANQLSTAEQADADDLTRDRADRPGALSESIGKTMPVA